jgi:hypothetical protein
LHVTAKTKWQDNSIDREASEQIKNNAVAALLVNIERIDLIEVCESLERVLKVCLVKPL